MTDPVIDIQAVSKRYHKGQRSMLRRRSDADATWALRDVSMRVEPGEVVGIIGPNGAGKSTLLKILSRITEPTAGRVLLRGRVASLLEVGTGFHPELTGRENIFVNGSILGLTRRQVRQRFDEIVAFSEVESFLDTPVKRYSSGMRVRLAFAVAAHLDPEVLIIDEVLSVGDAGFQHRCLGKMRTLASEAGRTVLFVSHNMGAVRSLCTRGVLMRDGRMIIDDEPSAVIARYFDLDQTATDTGSITWTTDTAPGDDALTLESVELTNPANHATGAFATDEPIDVTIRYRQHRALPQVRLVVQVRSQLGEVAFTGTDQSCRDERVNTPGQYTARCTIPAKLLNVGQYALRVWAGEPGRRRIADAGDCLRFSVRGIGQHGSTSVETTMPGVVCPQLNWSVRPTVHTTVCNPTLVNKPAARAA